MKIFAFYLPQFHEIPENNNWYGKGFTAWDNVRSAQPLFLGHQQPVIPLDHNYYDLLDVSTLKWQAKLVKDYKLSGLAFYHYYTKGYKLLEKPAEILLANLDIDLPFFFCWANHDWTNRWKGIDEKVLIKQEYGDKSDWAEHFAYLLPFFKDFRYEKRENKPVFMLYASVNFPQKTAMIDYFNSCCIEAGFDGIYIIEMYHGEDIENFKTNCLSPSSSAILLHEPSIGFLRNKPIKAIQANEIPIYDGNTFLDYSWTNTDKFLSDLPVYRSLVFSWDNTPRWKQRGSVITQLSEEKFKTLLNMCKDDEYLFINAWNEWDEGMMLEPTEHNRYKYLNWIKDWVDEPSTHQIAYSLSSSIVGKVNYPIEANKKHKTILLYTPELTYTGSLIMLLWTAKSLIESGYDVEVRSRLDGKFCTEFSTVGIKVIVGTDSALATLDTTKYYMAIVNTIVGAQAYSILHKKIPSLWIIHETGFLSQYFQDCPIDKQIFLTANDADILACSKYTSDFIKTNYNKSISILNNCVLESENAPVETKNEKAITNFGFLGRITPYKHPDLLVQAYKSLSEYYKARSRLFLAGAKDPDVRYKDFLATLFSDIATEPNIFTENLGARTIIGDDGCFIIDSNNKSSLKEFLEYCIDNPDSCYKVGEMAYQNYMSNASYSKYSTDLVKYVQTKAKDYSITIPKIGTLVVTYNHENYLDETLQSALSQTGPFKQIIYISDDMSTDNTRTKIKEYVKKYPGKIIDISPSIHLGVSENYKRGLHYVAEQSDYVAILEGDAYWLPNKLATLLGLFKNNLQVNLAFGAIKLNFSERINFNTLDTLPQNNLNLHKTLITEADILAGPWQNLILNLSSVMLRAPAILSLPDSLFDNYFFSEVYLQAYFARDNGQIGYSPMPLSIYRIDNKGIWSDSTLIQKHYISYKQRETACLFASESLKLHYYLKMLLEAPFLVEAGLLSIDELKELSDKINNYYANY